MKTINTIFKRAKMEQIISYLLDKPDTMAEKIDDFESKIIESYDNVFGTLEEKYSEADRNDDELFEMVAEFASIHDEAFLTLGLAIGYNLNRELEETWKKIKVNNMQ